MTEIINKLQKQTKVDCPKFIPENIILEGIVGSHSYSCNNPDSSDYDYYGVAIPPKEYIYIHEAGYIPGFDTNVPTFKQFQMQFESQDKVKYDIVIYNIIKFFNSTINGAPNHIDFLYIPINCITQITKVGTLIRDNRHLFLSKKLYHSYLGYSWAQFSKIKNRTFENSNRRIDVEKYGYSLKEAYNLVRLLCEIKQILVEETLDLQRDKEHYKAIRKGDFTLEEIQDWFNNQEKILEKLYIDSKLPHTPRYDEVRSLLLHCLEEFYGSMSKSPVNTNLDSTKQFNCMLNEIEALYKKYKIYSETN